MTYDPVLSWRQWCFYTLLFTHVDSLTSGETEPWSPAQGDVKEKED